MNKISQVFSVITQLLIGLLLSILALFLVLSAIAQLSVFNIDFAKRVVVKAEFAERIQSQIVNDSAGYLAELGLRPSLLNEAMASFDFQEEIISYLQYRYSDSKLPLDEQAFLKKSKELLTVELIVPNTKPDGSYDPLLDQKVTEILSEFSRFYRAPLVYTWFDYLLSNLTMLRSIVSWLMMGSALGIIGLYVWLIMLAKQRTGLITTVVLSLLGLWLILIKFTWPMWLAKYVSDGAFGMLFKTGFTLLGDYVGWIGLSFWLILLIGIVINVSRSLKHRQA